MSRSTIRLLGSLFGLSIMSYGHVLSNNILELFGAVVLFCFILVPDKANQIIDNEPHLEIFPIKKRLPYVLCVSTGCSMFLTGFMMPDYELLVSSIGIVLIFSFSFLYHRKYLKLRQQWKSDNHDG